MKIQIRDQASCELDLVSLGECMIRLSPAGHGRLEFAHQLEVWVGGGEYNVAYGLARLGLRTGWVSKLPQNPLGRLILNHGRAVGMDMGHVVPVPYDGVGRQNRVGLNFTEVGTGLRPSVTMYDRGHSAASLMRPGEIDWEEIFTGKGVRWFHLGGIFTALSDDTALVAAEAMKAAKRAGTIVSYDLNFRSKLWSSEKARQATRPLVQYIDFLIGNEEDFQKVLGFEVEGVDETLSQLPVENYKKMVERVVESFPDLKGVGTTLREVVSGLINHWSAILYYDGVFYGSRRYENLEIEDRVGGGDGFSSGIIYGFLTGKEPPDCVELGAAHGALLQSTRGDTSMITLEEVLHVMAGGTARIKR
ncbi:MAG: sugar kinase [Deltaproteobacteria bacterium]|nr:sugar kinase [Deltaproteobacteria bacterium]MBW2309068.1 sugar kinase [Deltaproteobacteria bacterium]